MQINKKGLHKTITWRICSSQDTAKKQMSKQDYRAVEMHWPADLAPQMWENICLFGTDPNKCHIMIAFFPPSENEDCDVKM